MENLIIRRKIAEALGCKSVLQKPSGVSDNIYLFCQCIDGELSNSHSEYIGSGKFLVLPYESDYLTTIEALIEFCKKNNCLWTIHYTSPSYECEIWASGPSPTYNFIVDGFGESLSLAICEAIIEAHTMIIDLSKGKRINK